MDFGLSQEQQMIVETVRNFVEKEIYPHEAEVERIGHVPIELGQSIKAKVIDLGFYACNFGDIMFPMTHLYGSYKWPKYMTHPFHPHIKHKYIQVSGVPRLIPSQKNLTSSLTSRKEVDFFADQFQKSRLFR